MTLIEVYKGYEIHEVEKRGRKMFQTPKTNTFTLESARKSIDYIYSEGLYILLDPGLTNSMRFGYLPGIAGGIFLTSTSRKRSLFELEANSINLTLAEL